LAKRRLEEARSDALVFTGRSSCVHLEVGRKFTLERHPDDTFNREWTITHITARGQRAGILADTGHGAGPGFTVSFSAVPSDINNPRPPRVAAPFTHPESAQVVGPTKGNPFVDKYGRVKVQFHWDREGKRDEHSSCWLRVMTPAAGGKRGIWFPPRVGDEVIVQHIDGDLDRPFVSGAIYNGDEMQPNPLPDQSSKSTIRTLSIPGGKGFHELTFTDTAGSEELFMHAQKDRKTVVLNNHNETVGANQSSSVGANQTVSVGANRTLSVGANETTSIKVHRSETVDSGEDVTITGDRTHTVKSGNDALKVTTGNRTVDIDAGNHTTNAKAGTTTLETQDWKAHATQTIALTGDQSITVTQGPTVMKLEGGNVSLEVGAETKVHHSGTTVKIEPSGKVSIEAAPEVEIKCAGATFKMGGGKVEISAPAEISLAVGGSSIKLTPASAETSATMVKSSGLALNEVTGLLVKLN